MVFWKHISLKILYQNVTSIVDKDIKLINLRRDTYRIEVFSSLSSKNKKRNLGYLKFQLH